MKTISILSLLVLLIITINTHAQNQPLEWVNQMSGIDICATRAITTDSDGNVITTGNFSDIIDFDPSAGVLNFTSNGNRDLFIQKLDANGGLVWAKHMGGSSLETGWDITTDVNGNVYSTGRFEDTVDFDPGVGIANLISSGSLDGYVQKLDANGNFLWVNQIGGISIDEGQGISVGPSGNIYVAGEFREVVDFDPGAGTANLTSNGAQDIFVQKLDSDGNLLWVKQMGGTSGDEAVALSTYDDGSVCVTGYFKETVDFDPGSGTANLTSNGELDVFVLKLNASGGFLWAKQLGGTGGDAGTSISTDLNGNTYVSGYFEETADLDPGAGTMNVTSNGASDMFIQKLDSNGNLLWAKRTGGIGNDLHNYIALDTAGNVYVTGGFGQTVDFDPGVGTTDLTSVGPVDAFIQKLDSNGDFIWVKQMSGIDGVAGSAITTYTEEKVYATGLFWGTADFDSGLGTSNLTSGGSGDSYVLKLGSVTTVGIIENDFGGEVLLFPNPTHDKFTINLTDHVNTVMVTITDLSGKSIQSKTFSESQSLSLNLEGPSGVYIVKIESADKRAIVRIVKE